MRTVRLSLGLICLWFAILAPVAPSEAQLGCFGDSGTPLATCTGTADCQPVGGTDCTNGFCLCNEGPLSPFCACAVPPTAAPTVSLGGMFTLVGILIGAGIFGLSRRRPKLGVQRSA